MYKYCNIVIFITKYFEIYIIKIYLRSESNERNGCYTDENCDL